MSRAASVVREEDKSQQGGLGYSKTRSRSAGRSFDARPRRKGLRVVKELYGRTSALPNSIATYLGAFSCHYYAPAQRASRDDVYRSESKINYELTQRRKSGSLCIIVSIIHFTLQAGWLPVCCLLHGWQKPGPMSSYGNGPSCTEHRPSTHFYGIPSPVAISARVCCSSLMALKAANLLPSV